MDGAFEANTGVSSNSEELMLSDCPLLMPRSYRRNDKPDNLKTDGHIAIEILPAAAESQNAGETAKSSSFNSNSKVYLWKDWAMTPFSVIYMTMWANWQYLTGRSLRDEIPDNLETGGQLTMEVSRRRKLKEAVKSFLFPLLCLIIPYHESHLLGNAGADERIKLLSTALMTFCTAWAVGQFLVSEEIRSKSPVFYDLVSITVAVAFCNVLVGNLIRDRSPVTAHATLVTGILLAIIAICMTLTIPLSLPIQWLIWLIFAFMLSLVVRCRSSPSGRRPGNDAVISLGDEQVDTVEATQPVQQALASADQLKCIQRDGSAVLGSFEIKEIQPTG